MTCLMVSSNFSCFSLTFKSTSNLLISLHFFKSSFLVEGHFFFLNTIEIFLTYFAQVKCILVTSLWKYSMIEKNLDTSQQNSGVVPTPTVWGTKVIVLLLCILCAFKIFMKLKCYWTAIIGNINLLYSF